LTRASSPTASTLGICTERRDHPFAFASLVPSVTMTRDEYVGGLKRKVSNWVAKHVKPAPNLRASERNSVAYMTMAKLPAALVASVLALHTKKEAVEEADPWYNPKGRKLDHTLTFPYDGVRLPTSACSRNRPSTFVCVKRALTSSLMRTRVCALLITVYNECRSPLAVNSGAHACS
jgi:hypothetical protein